MGLTIAEPTHVGFFGYTILGCSGDSASRLIMSGCRLSYKGCRGRRVHSLPGPLLNYFLRSEGLLTGNPQSAGRHVFFDT